MPIAVGADVSIGSVDMLEAGDIRPDVLQADGEEQSAHVQPVAAGEGELEGAIVASFHRIADAVDERGTGSARFIASAAAQLGGANARQAKKAIHAARLPIAWIAGVDEDDAVEIAGEPDAGGESGGAAADDRDVGDFSDDFVVAQSAIGICFRLLLRAHGE